MADLDAAVEAACDQMRDFGHAGTAASESMMRTVIEAALPHLPVAPSGEPQEPSEEAVERMGQEVARRRQEEANAAGNWEGRSEPLDPSLAWGLGAEDWREEIRQEMRGLVRLVIGASSAGRPREPSPELRERVAKAIERAYYEFDLSCFSKLDDRFWPEAADAALAVLREEQGGQQ